MTTLARILIFTSVHSDSVSRAQHFPNFTFHRILPNFIHRGSVNLRMNSIPVCVTLIRLADIYLLLDKINSILSLQTFNAYNVYNQHMSNSHYHIGYRNAERDTRSEYFHLGWIIYLDLKSSVLIKIVLWCFMEFKLKCNNYHSCGHWRVFSPLSVTGYAVQEGNIHK